MEVSALQEEVELLRARVRELELRLKEPEEIIRAIREGEVDAFVVDHPHGERIYSLRAVEGLYRVMVEEMNEGAAVLDPSGLIVYCNPHFATLIGVERQVVLGSSILPFASNESRSFFDSLRHESPSGARREIVLMGRDGEPIPVMASMSRIRLDEYDVFGLIVSDLREKRQRQALLADNIRKDEFLAMLAHELRNPIAPISNAIALMASPTLSEESFEWALRLIDRQVKQLVRLLDDLLDVQRFTQGIIGLKTESTDLVTLVTRAVDAVRGSVDAKSQVLHVQCSAEKLPVMGDAARLTQVISNLLVNAVKYSPSGREIRVTCAREGPQASIRIADTGMGMTPELLSRIFEPFVQGNQDLSRTEGGLGLGLTLVKRLVELHGGSVAASSAGPGRGSEFVVRIPLLIHSVAASEQAAAQPPRRGQAAVRRVLVVDDNEDSAVSLSALLKLSGHKVELANDGVEALRTARTFQPEVVVLDIGLPGMDGYEVARHLRDIEGLDQCRFIALTGYGRAEDRIRARDAGFRAHLVKPVRLEALLNVITSLWNETSDDRR